MDRLRYAPEAAAFANSRSPPRSNTRCAGWGPQARRLKPSWLSGTRAALPHARPTDKRLRKNELVVLDLGAILAHYCSDITRTVVLLAKRRRSSRRGIKQFRKRKRRQSQRCEPAQRCGEVDAAARQVLAAHRLDQLFHPQHGTWPGSGSPRGPAASRKGRKHSWSPGTSSPSNRESTLPGVGGIRIEDDVAVHCGRIRSPDPHSAGYHRDLIQKGMKRKKPSKSTASGRP